MFHWICPECGREIPPTVKECQACDPNAAQKIAPVEPSIESIAELVAAPLPPALPEPPTALVDQRPVFGAITETPIEIASSVEPVSVSSEPVEPPAVIPVATTPVDQLSVPPPQEIVETEPRPSGAVSVEAPAATQQIVELEAATSAEPAAPAPDPDRQGGDQRPTETSEPVASEPHIALEEIVELEASTSAEAAALAPNPDPEGGDQRPAETAEPIASEPRIALAEVVELEAATSVEPAAPAPNPDHVGVDRPQTEAAAPLTIEPLLALATASTQENVEVEASTSEQDVAPALNQQPTEAAAPVAEAPPTETASSAEPVAAPPLPAPQRVVADHLAETLELPIPRITAPYLILHPESRPTVAISPVDVVPAPPLAADSDSQKTTEPDPQQTEAVQAPVAEAVTEAANPAEPVAEELPIAPLIAAISDSQKTTDEEPRPSEAVSDAPTPEPAHADAKAPVIELEPTPEPVVAEANAPEPPSIAQPPAPETLIPVHELPDPLLALAEEIRAAQAARAATGLFKLAGAVGIREPELEPTPAHKEATPQPEVVETTARETAAVETTDLEATPVQAVAAIALLAPPEPAASVSLPEPAGIQDARPVALAPVPSPAAEPEPDALAEPQEQPVALATEPSREGPTLPLAPLQVYTPATSRSIQPVPPRAQILAAETGPRITLPGPTLPPQLARLHEANVVTIIGEDTAIRKKEAIEATKPGGTPGWLVSGLVMMLLLAIGLAAVFYLFPHSVADAKPVPMPATAATTPAPTTGGNSPLAKLVEVTGFRIVTSSADANKKSEVQYLIVNHSDADVSDANVFITLRGNKPGQPPLVRFSFKIPSLGPYESKEMSSPIEKSPRALTLPDWQDLRAEVQISQ